MNKYVITNFAKRHFDPEFGGTKILDHTVEEFESKLNSASFFMEDGYADFFDIIPQLK